MNLKKIGKKEKKKKSYKLIVHLMMVDSVLVDDFEFDCDMMMIQIEWWFILKI